MKRRRARECALKMMFQMEFTGMPAPGREFFDRFWKEMPEEGDDVRRFCEIVVMGTAEKISEIDALLKGTAEHWVLERMASVDRNIMRLAAYEILFMRDIPPAVTINEALEIAKKYSTGESAAFINGILDKLAKTSSKN